MKATKLKYEKLFNTGNFQHEKIGIELEIEDGEEAIDVLTAAKQFINIFDPNNDIRERIKHAHEIINNPNDYLYKVVEKAKLLLKKLEEERNADLPF